MTATHLMMSIVTIYKNNYIPLILPLKLQNELLSTYESFMSSTVSLGSQVDIGRTSGNYIVSSTGNLYIKATGDIDVNNGFIVEEGGIVTLNSDSKVIITGLSGTVNIESPLTEIKEGFVLNSGDSAIIRSNGLVKIKGGIIETGAELIIKANQGVVIEQGFNVALGGKINIKQ